MQGSQKRQKKLHKMLTGKYRRGVVRSEKEKITARLQTHSFENHRRPQTRGQVFRVGGGLGRDRDLRRLTVTARFLKHTWQGVYTPHSIPLQYVQKYTHFISYCSDYTEHTSANLVQQWNKNCISEKSK